MSLTQDLFAHREVSAVAAIVGHRARGGVPDGSPGGGCVVHAPALHRLDGHVSVWCDADDGTAGSSRHTGQNREQEVQTAREQEDRAHGPMTLDGRRTACQRPPSRLAAFTLASQFPGPGGLERGARFGLEPSPLLRQEVEHRQDEQREHGR